jgi:hypothetical protein
MSPSIGFWKVVYSTAKDLARGREMFYDGELHHYPSKAWIALVNAKGSTVGGRFLQNGEFLDADVTFLLPDHKVLLTQCLHKPISAHLESQMSDLRQTSPLIQGGRSGKFDRGFLYCYETGFLFWKFF